MRISEKGLPKTEPERERALWHRRRHLRNSLIMQHYMEAEDKEAAVAELAERYGFTSEKYILNIIEKMKEGGAIVAAMAANVEVLRRFRRQEVLRDNDEYRAALDVQIRELEALMDDGQTMVDVEEIEEGDKIKIKRVRISAELRRLYAERSNSHASESKALSDYDVKQREAGPQRGTFDAAQEFVTEFNRMVKTIKRGTGEIETDAEIVQ